MKGRRGAGVERRAEELCSSELEVELGAINLLDIK